MCQIGGEDEIVTLDGRRANHGGRARTSASVMSVPSAL